MKKHIDWKRVYKDIFELPLIIAVILGVVYEGCVFYYCNVTSNMKSLLDINGNTTGQWLLAGLFFFLSLLLLILISSVPDIIQGIKRLINRYYHNGEDKK